jgi:hypothetical protein
MDAPSPRTYILERTRGFFVGQPDEPCSGATRFEPADSGVLRFDQLPRRRQHAPPSAWWLILRPLRRSGLVLGPHRRRGKRERPGLLRSG